MYVYIMCIITHKNNTNNDTHTYIHFMCIITHNNSNNGYERSGMDYGSLLSSMLEAWTLDNLAALNDYYVPDYRGFHGIVCYGGCVSECGQIEKDVVFSRVFDYGL